MVWEIFFYFFYGYSVYFISMNCNKKLIIFNLKDLQGLDLFYCLVKIFDVVYDNYCFGVLEKLWVDYEILKKINFWIIFCFVLGYGYIGFYKDWFVYDLIIQV